MRMSGRRIRAVVRKELREYRRHGSVVVATAIFPLIFLIQPLILVFMVPSAGAATLEQWHVLLYMLAIPVLTPRAVRTTCCRRASRSACRSLKTVRAGIVCSLFVLYQHRGLRRVNGALG